MSALLGNVAALVIALSGVAQIIQQRVLAKNLLVCGFAVAANAAIGPVLTGAGGIAPLDILRLVSPLVGLLALAAGTGKLGAWLIWTASCRWVLWPLVGPYAEKWPLTTSLSASLTIFILIWLVQRVPIPSYGDRAAGYVTGEYLVRAIDGVGRVLGGLIVAPFNLILQILDRRP